MRMSGEKKEEELGRKEKAQRVWDKLFLPCFGNYNCLLLPNRIFSYISNRELYRNCEHIRDCHWERLRKEKEIE